MDFTWIKPGMFEMSMEEFIEEDPEKAKAKFETYVATEGMKNVKLYNPKCVVYDLQQMPDEPEPALEPTAPPSADQIEIVDVSLDRFHTDSIFNGLSPMGSAMQIGFGHFQWLLACMERHQQWHLYDAQRLTLSKSSIEDAIHVATNWNAERCRIYRETVHPFLLALPHNGTPDVTMQTLITNAGKLADTWGERQRNVGGERKLLPAMRVGELLGYRLDKLVPGSWRSEMKDEWFPKSNDEIANRLRGIVRNMMQATHDKISWTQAEDMTRRVNLFMDNKTDDLWVVDFYTLMSQNLYRIKTTSENWVTGLMAVNGIFHT